MDSEREPFIPFKDSSIELNFGQSPSRGGTLHRPFRAGWKKALFFHSALVTIYSITGIFIVRSYRCTAFAPTSPIDNLSIEYLPTVSHNLTGNPFAGSPTPEIDAAWDSLMAPMHIRITKEELQHSNQKSVPLDSGGYLGWMGVFHELHCIRMLREWNYKDYYHPNISAESEEHLKSHIDHCFEMLRQSAMCHADASITTFKWDPKASEPMFNASEAIHTCVDWEKLIESLAIRVIHEDEILQLKNPLMSTKLDKD